MGTFGNNKIHNFSSSHHDIWNTNKLNFSNKFEPVKYVEPDDLDKKQTKRGKVSYSFWVNHMHRKGPFHEVNIMQFSEQKWNRKRRNDMNPVELRLGFMKSNRMGINDNFGYQRDDLTK